MADMTHINWEEFFNLRKECITQQFKSDAFFSQIEKFFPVYMSHVCHRV